MSASQEISGSHITSETKSNTSDSNCQASQAVMLSDGSIDLFHQGAAHLRDSMPRMIQAFQSLQSTIAVTQIHQESFDGRLTSVDTAKHFKILCKAAMVTQADLAKAQELSTFNLQSAAESIHDRRVLPALIAINDLNRSVMALYTKLRKFNELLDKTLNTATRPLKLELEALNFPAAIMTWKQEYGDWLTATERPAWAAARAELVPH